MKNYTLSSGLIIGFTAIVISAVCYFMGVNAMVSGYNILITVVAYVGLLLFFGFRYRAENGGYLSFKEAFVFIFFTSVIATVISGLFTILLIHVINPGLEQSLQDAIIQKSISWMQYFGAPQEKIDQSIAQMQSEPGKFTVASQLKGIVLNFITLAILALILGAIIKKTRPPFTNVTTPGQP